MPGAPEDVVLKGALGSLRGSPLTLRERETLLLICEGFTGKEIAHRMGISTSTVEYHKGRISQRLGVKSIARMVRYAIRAGLIEA